MAASSGKNGKRAGAARSRAGSGSRRKSSTSSSGSADLRVNRAALLALSSALAQRANLAARLGKSFDDDRDLYEALGYPKTLQFDNLFARYKRQDVAARLVDIFPDYCWKQDPEISEQEGGEDITEFERQWVDLDDRLRFFHYFERVDRLARIGNYAVLFFGFGDGAPPSEPVDNAELKYLQVYSQRNAKVVEYERDESNERFGKPLFYQLTYKAGSVQIVTRVHWSRVLHVAENPLEVDEEGVPVLESVYNRLEDLARISGGSGEGYWRGGAFPGMKVSAKEGYSGEKQTDDDLLDELEEYLHGFKRYLALEGYDVDPLTPNVVDPRGHADLQLTLIATAKGIPKRVLMGTERGELASSQDETMWRDQVERRCRKHCEPNIIRPAIAICQRTGNLVEPPKGYGVLWPSISEPTDQEKAGVAKTRTEALKAYVTAPGAEQVIPETFFRRRVLQLTVDEENEIQEMLKTQDLEEGRQAEEDARAAASPPGAGSNDEESDEEDTGEDGATEE